mmetsp:Transcript_7526/g.20345  ORF Transcript_7526/g.20345 Transcript_7526/m.20345 type:complete len:347 (-) Transcript_7526:402-1442(-)
MLALVHLIVAAVSTMIPVGQDAPNDGQVAVRFVTIVTVLRDALQLVLKSGIVQHMLVPQLHDALGLHETRVAKSNPLPLRQGLPIAIDVGPHADVVLFDQGQRGSEPHIPHIHSFVVQSVLHEVVLPRLAFPLDATKWCGLRNHDGLAVVLSKVHDLFQVLDGARAVFGRTWCPWIELLEDGDADPIDVVIAWIELREIHDAWRRPRVPDEGDLLTACRRVVLAMLVMMLGLHLLFAHVHQPGVRISESLRIVRVSEARIVELVADPEKDLGGLRVMEVVEETLDVVIEIPREDVLAALKSIQPQPELQSRTGRILEETRSEFHAAAVVNGGVQPMQGLNVGVDHV